MPVCDRNGNNLLMIAPNNHLPLRRSNGFPSIEMPRFRKEAGNGVKNEKEEGGKDIERPKE